MGGLSKVSPYYHIIAHLTSYRDAIGHRCAMHTGPDAGEYKPWTKHGRSMDKRLYYRLCVSRRIDTRQIVYLLYEDACPIISIHKNEI